MPFTEFDDVVVANWLDDTKSFRAAAHIAAMVRLIAKCKLWRSPSNVAGRVFEVLDLLARYHNQV